MAFDYGNRNLSLAENQGRNTGMYMNTLLGQSIADNPVPVWTTDKAMKPFVGFQDPKTGKIFGISKKALSYGMLAIGPPGTGKTNLFNMIVDRLLVNMGPGDVLVIFDTKGDYLETFGSRIPKDELIVIGNGEGYRSITGYHNIFAEVMPRGKDGRLVYTRESDEDALELCEQLFSAMNSEIQPVFPAMAEQIMAAVMIYFMRSYWKSDPFKLNNKALIDFLSGSTNEELISIFKLDYMADQRSCMDYISNKSSQTQGVNSYLGSMLKKMFIGPFSKADPAREFSMRDIICGGRKKHVFIEYDLKKGNLLSPMYGILLDRAFANALGGRQTKRHDTFFLLDEALLLPKLEHLPDALNFGRSRGVKVMCGLQNIAGLEDLYGNAGAGNVLSSFRNMVAFRMTDYDSRQFIINRLGGNYQNYSFSAQQKNLNIQREGYTVEDWQLLSLKLGEAVVSLSGESPFLFTMPVYRQ